MSDAPSPRPISPILGALSVLDRVGHMTFKERIDAYERLMRLDKPIGILLLLWPTLWALWLSAPGVIRLEVLVIFLLGTVLTRSAGCVINDFADRDFDPHVERTRDRPLAAGRVRPGEALALAAVLLLFAFALVLQLNALTVYLSLFAVAITAVYPFLKRFFALPQAGLPEPLRSLVRERVPALLLLPNERGLWALAPFELQAQ